ncbi:MAG: thiamine diphosphokinase [Pseudomonadota bacterium]
MLPNSLAIAGAQTLVGGAPVNIETIDRALTRAPRLVAVDGGADACLLGRKSPDLVVGDLDSISEEARATYASILRHETEQESTDFAKALRLSPAPFSLAVGFLGARIDHTLACLSTLAATGAPCILFDETDCLCIAPGSGRVDLPPGTRFSIWPLGVASGTSEGLRWPLSGVDFAPGGRGGTSNEALGPVSWSIRGGPMVLILPTAHLDGMISMVQIASRETTAARL